jgi:hypothetical protein
MTDRNELIDAVKYGLMSIEEGEAAAKEAGLDPLETMPAGERYDPRNRTYWTLAEVLTWIHFRNFDAVREFGEAWRNDRMIFVGSDSVLSDGRNIAYEYTRLGPASLIDLGANGVQIDASFDALKGEVGAGNIEITGRPDNGGDRVRIETFRWADLSHFGDVDGGIFVRTANSKGRITGGGFDDVLVKANGLIAAFPAGDAVRPTKAIQAKRGRKPKPIKEQCSAFLNQLFEEHGDFDPGYDEWNCQARAEEKIKEQYDLRDSTARVYVRDYMKVRNSEN